MIIQALETMLFGMIGIFLVIGIIIGAVKLLAHIGGKEDRM